MKTDNELIAEFMGFECPRCLPSGKVVLDKSDLRYHTSWDWLMPVVEKIHSLRMDVNLKFFITNSGKTIRECLIEDQIGETIGYFDSQQLQLIECAYKSVIQFINWYNANNLK